MDACSLGQLGEPYTGSVIDLVSEPRFEIAKGIIRKSRQMQNCVTASEIGGVGVPNILADRRYLADIAAFWVRAAGIQVAVETRHFVPGLDQHRHQNGTDIAE